MVASTASQRGGLVWLWVECSRWLFVFVKCWRVAGRTGTTTRKTLYGNYPPACRVYQMRVLVGDCREVLKEIPDCSVDSVVCDPPYELGFMGKSWDSTGVAYDVLLWGEVLRVLKPGGHLLAFGGSRTYHRLACAVEDAGFEVRDQIMWVYGSGFPKSLDVSKAIEGKVTTGSSNKKDFKLLSGEQVERGNWGIAKQQFVHGQRETNYDETAGETRLGRLEPTTEEAKRWVGWGTALKPAHEPIVVARKPLVGTVAANVLKWGVGGLNIDGCRVGDEVRFNSFAGNKNTGMTAGDDRTDSGKGLFAGNVEGGSEVAGRWPANLIHDGSDEVMELFPETASTGNGSISGKRRGGGDGNSVGLAGVKYAADGYNDGGSAARFFYCAKAGKKERNAGLDHLEPKRDADRQRDDLPGGDNPRNRTNKPRQNHHPTVKPIALMRYLVRLVTPPNGTVLDPFTGSGTTGIAAVCEGFRFVGIEQNEEYARIAEARIQFAVDDSR